MAQQQIVEIGKALQMESRVFILVKPTDVLTDKETVVLFDIIRELRASGKALIYISHRLDELPEICDTFSVLRDGHYMGSGSIKDCTKADIIRLMIGPGSFRAISLCSRQAQRCGNGCEECTAQGIRRQGQL